MTGHVDVLEGGFDGDGRLVASDVTWTGKVSFVYTRIDRR